MNPEHEALIIREHARLREAIIKLPRTDDGLIGLGAVLALLHPIERDGKAFPQRSPRPRIVLD